MTWLTARFARTILLSWAVASVVFLAIRLAPGNAAAPPEQHLERPLLTQYVDNLARLLTGDLGRSTQDGGPVARKIGRRLPRTLELIGLAALLAGLIGVPGGLLAGSGRHGALDRIATALSAYALAVPVFVAGTLLMLLFAQTLRWAPADDPFDHPALLAMAAISIAIGFSASVFRTMRTAVLAVTERDFVRAARAKGLGQRRILVHHVLRNALVPVLTALKPGLGTLLGGTVLVEYVFNYPGLFDLLIRAVSARDYPIVAGVVLVTSVMFLLLNLAADLLCAALDPRIRAA